ncbi:telomere stability and silencing-domain-containing protein, partial [Limtongia smithiae]|uniref:telomere stability and silencing-domain-containing protein n=1 Tax=Limtongia smithiae TaxID=1125753 RepID=UPI0034CDC9C2
MELTVSVSVATFTGLAPFTFDVSPGANLQSVLARVAKSLPASVASTCGVSLRSGRALPVATTTAGTVCHGDTLELRLNPRLLGGKGGFGSQLRAQGGRMTARRKRGGKVDEAAKDEFRNLDGRRMKSIRQAKDLAVYLETAPQKVKELAAKRKARLQALVNAEAAPARFEDTQFLEESEELIDELKRIVGESFAFGEEE